jgi:hypothetical protein
LDLTESILHILHSRGGTPKHTQTVLDATQKENAIDQQNTVVKHRFQRHQTILRLLSNAATASTRWRVRELYCQTTLTHKSVDTWLNNKILLGQVQFLRGLLSTNEPWTGKCVLFRLDKDEACLKVGTHL